MIVNISNSNSGLDASVFYRVMFVHMLYVALRSLVDQNYQRPNKFIMQFRQIRSVLLRIKSYEILGVSPKSKKLFLGG